MRFTTVFTGILVGLGLVAAVDVSQTPSSKGLSVQYDATSPAVDPTTQNVSTLQIDATTMRRTMFLVGYSSSAAAVGLTMQAFNSEAWCLSDANKDWCPNAIKHTVSGIAGQVANTTGANKVRKVLSTLH